MKLETKIIGKGDDQVLVNLSDYKAGFPDNKDLAKKVKELEAEPKPKAEPKVTKKATKKTTKKAS